MCLTLTHKGLFYTKRIKFKFTIPTVGEVISWTILLVAQLLVFILDKAFWFLNHTQVHSTMPELSQK